jgi:hypothetical protein
MDRITIEVDSKWARIIRSPVFFVIAALQGVSISFAPYFLYLSAQGRFFPGYEGITVPLCFAIIYLVPAFYFALGSAVVRELKRKAT